MRRATLTLLVGVWTQAVLSLAALCATALLVPAPAHGASGTAAPTAAAPPAAVPAVPAPHIATEPPEPEGFWTGPTNDPVPNTIKGGKVIHTRQLAALLKRSKQVLVIVDVSNGPRRPDSLPATTTWIPVPHPGIPGALWIPGAGLGEVPPVLDQYFRERLATATGNDLGKPLIIYCHEKCWLSWNGAKRAIQYGYRNVYWFPEGIEGWRKAKLPTVAVQPEPVP
jgi:PQQ-dependent catabolism-associated CXXCW motif protein